LIQPRVSGTSRVKPTPRARHHQRRLEEEASLALVDTRNQRDLTPAEEQLLAELGERHDRVMVLHAKAVALLHRRDVDVSERVARA
jgi:hypothetical protein